MIKYVIFGLPRTGSSLLGELLATQPASIYETELLHPKFWRGWRSPLYRLLRFYPYSYIDYRCHLAHRQGTSLYGFKLFPHHVHAPRTMLLELQRRQWRILHIQRRDLFDQVLSMLVARQTGRFNGSHVDDPPRLYLDPTIVAEELRICRQKARETGDLLLGIDHLDVVYEDDLCESGQWNTTLTRIASAWGIHSVPAQTGYRRTWQEPYSEFVINYLQLKKHFETARP